MSLCEQKRPANKFVLALNGSYQVSKIFRVGERTLAAIDSYWKENKNKALNTI